MRSKEALSCLRRDDGSPDLDGMILFEMRELREGRQMLTLLVELINLLVRVEEEIKEETKRLV